MDHNLGSDFDPPGPSRPTRTPDRRRQVMEHLGQMPGDVQDAVADAVANEGAYLHGLSWDTWELSSREQYYYMTPAPRIHVIRWVGPAYDTHSLYLN